jgi:hypothetical protein
VSRWFALLPAFVGAGLVYAGVTDRCGMAMLLAKLPSNNIGTDSGAGAAAVTEDRGSSAVSIDPVQRVDR